jgi:hypothetical protein
MYFIRCRLTLYVFVCRKHSSASFMTKWVLMDMSDTSETSGIRQRDALLHRDTSLRLLQAGFNFRPEQEGTLLSKLGREIFAGLTREQFWLNPRSVLTSIFTSVHSYELGRQLADEFSLPGYFTSPENLVEGPQFDLLRDAIINDLLCADFSLPNDWAGFDLAAARLAGLSYPVIIAQAEEHLLTSGHAALPAEAAMAVYLLASEFHPDFLVRDIPSDLPYGASTVWVNFKHGVALAEAEQRGGSENMTFQALVDLPAHRSTTLLTEDDHAKFESARLEPSLIWAHFNGLLRAEAGVPYSSAEASQALEELASHESEIQAAINLLTDGAPDRVAMAIDQLRHPKLSPAALSELSKSFDIKDLNTHYLLPDQRMVPAHYGDVYLIGLGRRPVWYNTPSKVLPSFTAGRAIERPSYSLSDVYLNNEDIERWRVPGKHHEEGSERLSDLRRQVYKALPNITELFEQRFTTFLQDARQAYGLLIRSALATLPLSHRQAIESGKVSLYSLRTETTNLEAGEETPKKLSPHKGRAGFVMRVQAQEKTSYYEVFPAKNLARHRPDIESLLVNGNLRTAKTKISKGGPVSVPVRRGTELPFDWAAYQTSDYPKEGVKSLLIVEALGAPLAEQRHTSGIPQTLKRGRAEAISRLIANLHFYTDEDSFRKKQKGVSPLVVQDPFEPLALLKSFTPWGDLEDLLSGDQDRIRKGAFGLFGFFLSFAGPMGRLAGGSLKLLRSTHRTVLLTRTLPVITGLNKMQRVNGRIGFSMSGRGPLPTRGSWTIDKSSAQFKANLAKSSQDKWDVFQNAIYNQGVTPQTASRIAGDTNLKRLQEVSMPMTVDGRTTFVKVPQYQIRLSGQDRATFWVDQAGTKVHVLQVGGHTP